jgi:hypothetical protein
MRVLLASFFLLSQFVSLAQRQPEWLDQQSRGLRYSSRDYLTGFSENPDIGRQAKPDEVIAFLREDAKAQLINSVRVNISSMSVLEQADTGEKKGYSENFKLYSTTSAELEIAGLKVEHFYDSKKRRAYAFAYARRADVAANYAGKAERAISAIQLGIEMAQAQASSGRSIDALLSLNGCLQHFREAEEAIALVYVLERFADEQAKQLSGKLAELRRKHDSTIALAKDASPQTLTEAAFSIANAYSQMPALPAEPVRLGSISYSDTEMGSQFSRRFNAELESRLIAEKKLDVRSSVPPGSDISLLLSGSYWDEGDKLRIVTSLRNTATGKLLYSAEALVSKESLTGMGIGFMPENFAQAHSRMKQFKETEVVSGGLSLEVWTNKGRDNLMFAEGERMKLYIRVNQDSYLRSVYHMADGTQVLLLDNYFMGSNAVNKVFELPYEFECAAPFGVEVLQVNAQSTPFEPLRTSRQYGYDIIEEDFPDVLVKTRGFKRVEPSKPQRSETRMTITTYAR